MKSFYKKGIAGLVLVAGLIAPSHAALVDVELSLVIDVSGSVDSNEYNLQMDGYAAAFRNADVIQNIENSVNGIAVNTVFFATNFYSTVLDDFSILKTAADASAFADVMDTFVRPGSGGTNIYTGVNRAIDLLLGNNLDATLGTVIDVSGDGTDNISSNRTARDRAVGEGFTVNGIAIGSSSIANFYRDNVIGGNGAFVIESADFLGFQNGIIEKLKIETTVATPVPSPTPVSAPATLAIMLIGLVSLFARRIA